MKTKNQTWDVVKAYETGGSRSLVVTVPDELRKELKILPGTKFVVKTDENSRIVLEKRGG